MLLPAAPSLSDAADIEPNGDHWQLLSVQRSAATAAALRPLPVLVEGGTRQRLHLQVLRSQRGLLDEIGISYEVLVADLASSRPAPGSGRDLKYHSPESLSARLHELAAFYPSIARVIDLGRSWQGRELTGLLITDQPWLREPDEPSLRVLGTHHGDEWASMEVSLDLIETLLASYESEPGLAAMVDGAELWFLPVVNPDGVTAYTRRNARGVDLNRNYAYLWQPSNYSGEAPFSEVEADAVRALSMNRSFSHSLSLHSGASNLGWVWNHTLEPAADAEFMQDICEDYLAATTQPEFWVTNGAQWYITFGDTNDWSYGVRGGHDYTLEVSVERSPDSALLEDLLAYHREPALEFLLAGFEAGVRGRVTDERGAPIEATITVDDLDSASFSDAETGAFARPLRAGSYTITFSAAGHTSESRTVEVSQGAATIVSTQLQRSSELEVELAAGLEAPVDRVSEARICATGIVDNLGGSGQVLVHRPGIGGPFDLDWHAAPKEPESCIVVTIDPDDVGAPWQREGEWHLRLVAEGGSVIAQLPLGVALVAADPGFVLDDLSISGPANELRVSLDGADLPTGAAVRCVGPAGQRALPSLRLSGDTSEQIAAQFDASQWADGLWSVRVFGRGHWAALPAALVVEGGKISRTKAATAPLSPLPDIYQAKGPAPDMERGDDDEQDGTPATGCSCVIGATVLPPSLPLALVLALGIGYFRRSGSFV